MADCRLGYFILFLVARKKREKKKKKQKKKKKERNKERCLRGSPSLSLPLLPSRELSEKSLSVVAEKRTEYKRIKSSSFLFFFFVFFLASFGAMWDSADTTASNAAGFNSQTSFYEYPPQKPFINSVHALRSTQTVSRTVALPESNRDNLLAALKSLTIRIKKLERDREVRIFF